MTVYLKRHQNFGTYMIRLHTLVFASKLNITDYLMQNEAV